MKVLVINCGSSSLKYQLIDSQTEEVLAKGLCERIGIDGSKLTHKPTGKEDYVVGSRCNHRYQGNLSSRPSRSARRSGIQRFYRCK